MKIKSFAAGLISMFLAGCAGRTDETWRVLMKVETPEQAFEYLENFWKYKQDSISPGETDDWRSLTHSIKNKGGDCDDYAIASAALLSDNGYAPKMLWLRGIEINPSFRGFSMLRELSHSVFLLEKECKYGLIENGRLIPPKYEKLEGLIRDYAKENKIWDGKYCIVSLPKTKLIVEAEKNLYPYLSSRAEMSEWKNIANK